MLVETSFHLIAPGRVADVTSWTDLLGISPSSSARRGEKAGSAPSLDSWWAYTLEKSQAETVEEPLLELLGRLAPLEAKIAALASSQNLQVSVTSYVWEPEQSLIADISPSTLSSLCQLGCSYAVVVYE
jgi:hypothetical protein